MSIIRGSVNRSKLASAASVASLALVSSAFGQSNVGASQVVISTAGSTALKNWFVKNTTTFTDIEPGTTLSINGTPYPPANYWTTNGGVSYQLAPKNNSTSTGGTTDQTAAIQFIYHESGSVEGILELANDQLYTNSDYAASSGILSTSIPYITANVDRNPEGGNAVWLNYNQLGASGTSIVSGSGFNATTGVSPTGTTVQLKNFYATGVGQSITPGETVLWTPGSSSNPTPDFSQAGANVNGGQNAVQVAVSDAIPQQVFLNNYANTSNTYGSHTDTGTNNTSYNATPLDYGYGGGNSALGSTQIGTPGFRAAYQDASVLNVSSTAQNPRAAQGTTFGAGPWTSATNGGLGNLNSQLTAITATTFVANPGTGLTQVNRTDADWLQLTSRFSNGAGFNMATRDVNSGTRDVAALDTGIDPSYASGKNDNGNGNLANGVSTTVFDQTSIGSAMRFSNKTAGGAQLRPTVMNNRFSVGTLSINDASGNDTQGKANPVRVLNYSDSINGFAADGITPVAYVSPNYATISNGSYVIYQNEQVVTLKNMSSVAAYSASGVMTATNGAQLLTGTVQGDDSSGDVVALLNNTAGSIAATANASSPANPGDGLLQQGFIIPTLMSVQKNINGQGLNNSVLVNGVDTGSITSTVNPNYNGTLYSAYIGAGGYGPSALPILTSQEPTTGSSSTYGGAGNAFARSFYNGAAIGITTTNYIGGNFNQNGIRDYSSLQSALAADRVLIAADQAVSASVPGSEFTSQGDNGGVAGGTSGVINTTAMSYTSALGGTISVTKGDLIVMGDYNGDGHFDGADLVALAENTALADAAGGTRLTITQADGAPAYDKGVLVKNAAMDYLNSTVGTTGADAYIRKSGAAILEAATVPSGATAILSPITGTQVLDTVAVSLANPNGLKEFTFDPTGVNTFNKSDINQDGVVDFNDAVLADDNNGMDYTNLAEQVAATQQSPTTGLAIPLNLAMVKQSDTSTVIGATDVSTVSGQLTGSGTTNWYGYNLKKTGPSTITYARTSGAVNVASGASFEVSSGTVNIGGSIDPFTGSGNHVSLNVDGGALNFTSAATRYNVSGLAISGAGKVDVGTNRVTINYTGGSPLASVVGEVHSGSLFTSSASSTYGLGYTDVSSQVAIAYALYGDINLDGAVNGTDFAVLAGNFGKSVTGGWTQGDLNDDGSVTGTDFALLAQNFGKSASGFAIDLPQSDWTALDDFAAANGLLADVPEPASIGLLAIGATGLLARRRRAK